jgi:UDP-N-acetylglucosamine acyltransferase
VSAREIEEPIVRMRTETAIHPTAIVSPEARIGEGVSIGAFAIVGPNCVIGDGCVLAPRATLEQNVSLGRDVKIGIGSVIGGDPQDLKYRGEETHVEIGDWTVIREYVTVNRGAVDSGKTTLGRHCLLMSYVHLAHDCHVGNHVIISNSTQLAGHVTVEDWAGMSGLCGIHQFARIGRNSYIGGASRVPQDVPPYVMAVGNPIRLYGLNSVGLRRNGFSHETMRELKRAYRLLFRSDLSLSQALARVAAEVQPIPEVQHLVSFIEASPRGVGF